MQFDKTLTERDFPVHYKIHASVDEQRSEEHTSELQSR